MNWFHTFVAEVSAWYRVLKSPAVYSIVIVDGVASAEVLRGCRS